MLDPTDYKEPACALCGGDFYSPDPDAPLGTVPVSRVIAKLDSLLDANRLEDAAAHLEYWHKEALALRDRRAELTVCQEMMGLYRKIGARDKGMDAIKRGLELVDTLGLSDTVSGATAYLNAATAYKAFDLAPRALELYDRAVEIYDRDLPADDIRQAGLRNNRAVVLADMSRFSDAEKDYFFAINVLLKAGTEDNDIAVTYVNLAYLYLYMEKQEKAIESMDNAWKYLNSDKIERNGYHAYVCSKCAPAFENFGFEERANELENRSKEIYARS